MRTANELRARRESSSAAKKWKIHYRLTHNLLVPEELPLLARNLFAGGL